jgi:hypothetical protein
MAISTGAAILGGSALGLLGGSKKSGSQTVTQNNTPWAGVQPYLTDAFNRGQSALSTGTPMTDRASGALNPYLSSNFLNPETNPAFSSAVSDALGLAKSQFAGQYGGQAGQNLGNSGYQEALARGLGSAATNAYANQYNKNAANQLAAIGAAPAFDQATSPFANLERYKSLLSLGTGFGTSQSSQPTYTNPFAGALGGALAGGQIGGMMNGPNLGFPIGFGSGWN